MRLKGEAVEERGRGSSKAMYSCEECEERLYPFLDRELDAGEQLLVREHLSLCRQCLNRFRFEGNVLRSVGEVARSVSCPQEVRLRILRTWGKEALT